MYFIALGVKLRTVFNNLALFCEEITCYYVVIGDSHSDFNEV